MKAPCRGALRVVGQRTDEAAPHQKLPRPRRERRGSCLKEMNFMTSQTKCAITFSTKNSGHYLVGITLVRKELVTR